jgi:hypothetical protein
MKKSFEKPYKKGAHRLVYNSNARTTVNRVNAECQKKKNVYRMQNTYELGYDDYR